MDGIMTKKIIKSPAHDIDAHGFKFYQVQYFQFM